MALPQDADDDLIKEDVAEVGTTNAVILQKIKRSNEDATGEMRSLFLNNVDFDATLPDFYVQIVSKYASSIFWVKSNGTDTATKQKEDVYKEAQRILIQRFQPVGSLV